MTPALMSHQPRQHWRHTMRVQPHDLRRLRAMISQLDTPARRDRYRAGDFYRADRVKDLDKRYRWDLFWLVNDTYGSWVSTLDYDVNDTHIDTALKAIVPPLGPAPAPSMFTVVGAGSYDAETDTLTEEWTSYELAMGLDN